MVVKRCVVCGSAYETLKNGNVIYYEQQEVQDKRYLDKFKDIVFETCSYCKEEGRRRKSCT